MEKSETLGNLCSELTSSTGSVPRARVVPKAVEAGWIVPAHGNGRLRPFTAGTGAVAARSSVRAARKASLALLAEATPEATIRLIELMRSQDERVATIAAAQIMDRVHGKAGSNSDEAAASTEPAKFSPRYLDADERGRLSSALKTISELATLAREREANPGA